MKKIVLGFALTRRSIFSAPDARNYAGLDGLFLPHCNFGAGAFDPHAVFSQMKYREFTPNMSAAERAEKYRGWKNAVRMVLSQKEAEK